MLLDLESSGGLNIWGPGGKDGCRQQRGSLVTEANYAEYKASRDECGAQGCGPLQITWPGLQDAADALGGCWAPTVNVRFGLTVFAGYLQRDTIAQAYSRWNTGKPGPSVYADKALALLPGWQKVIDG